MRNNYTSLAKKKHYAQKIVRTSYCIDPPNIVILEITIKFIYQ